LPSAGRHGRARSSACLPVFVAVSEMPLHLLSCFCTVLPAVAFRVVVVVRLYESIAWAKRMHENSIDGELAVCVCCSSVRSTPGLNETERETTKLD
jgi:hypothetical protein